MSDANLYQNLRANWSDPAAPALYDAPGVISYGDLDDAVADTSAALDRMGLRSGDRVAMALAKSNKSLVIILALLRSGIVMIPVDPLVPRQVAEDILTRTSPALLLVSAQFDGNPVAGLARMRGTRTVTIDASDELAPFGNTATAPPAPASVDPDAPAIILFTSGSTGRPKGVPVTHSAILSNAEALRVAWGIDVGDRLLHVLPLTHAHGIIVALMPMLLAGAAICLRPRFEPGDVIARLPRATCFMGVPFIYAQLLDRAEFGPETCASVRLFTCGSAPLPDDLLRAFEARSNRPLYERYGMTETLISTANRPGAHRAGTVGRTLPGVSLRIRALDGSARSAPECEGEVEVRGPAVLHSYLDASAETPALAEDGYVRTGDLGRLDGGGFLTITGRIKDLIIYAGLKVHPGEVEAVLRDLDGVVDACVFGVPHPSAGEAVMAAVVCAGGMGDAAGLRRQLVGRLVPGKVPKRIFLLTDLPRNAMGKLQRTILRDRYADGTLAPAQDGLRADTST